MNGLRLLLSKNKFLASVYPSCKKENSFSQKGYGYATFSTANEVDPTRSMFRIGSVSKTLIAMAIALARMYEQGMVSLDTTIQTYVPKWPEKAHDINLKLLAGHLGIRHYRGLEFMSRDKYETVAEGLAIFKNDDLINEPGTEYPFFLWMELDLGGYGKRSNKGAKGRDRLLPF